MTTPFTILVGIPIDSSGPANGLERMPRALRDAGLVRQLGLRDDGDLPVAIDTTARDPVTGMIGFAAVCRSSETIRLHIKQLLARGERPLVLGGCCTLLIGVCAALREHYGRAGLVFVDGHLDFYDGLSSPTGEAADMDLAILTGSGPAGLVDLAGAPPLVAPCDTMVLGFRDAAEAAWHGAPDPAAAAPGITLVAARDIRNGDPGALGREAAGRFTSEPKRFWLHFDLDVLDQAVLPAVDYPMPDGLQWAEAAELIRPLIDSPALLGADITIFNPDLDPGGRHAREIVSWLVRILA